PTPVARIQDLLRIETRSRAIVRTWRYAAADVTGSVAFLVLGHEDYALALWSEATGLALEDEQRCERDANTQIKCRHAADVFAEMVNGSTADELNIPAVTKAVISAPKDCMGQLMD